jgi:hypothetical protein
VLHQSSVTDVFFVVLYVSGLCSTHNHSPTSKSPASSASSQHSTSSSSEKEKEQEQEKEKQSKKWDGCGVLIQEEEELNAMVKKAHTNGFRIEMHGTNLDPCTALK